MKKIKDKFSEQSRYYKKFRPTYPIHLYEEILKYIKSRKKCWDCGTGNGQVAIVLSEYFEKIYATDISENQITIAEKKDNIIYKVERAEKTSFKDNQFDLITVAQAIHWFDLNAFYQEVRRVGKNGGIISVWGYGLPRINNNINKLLDHFYWDIVGPYWNTERKHIDSEYKSIAFDFEEIPNNKKFFINTNWSIDEFLGYLNSWSGVHNYIQTNKNNPVNWMIKRLSQYWNDKKSLNISFPIFLKTGRIAK